MEEIVRRERMEERRMLPMTRAKARGEAARERAPEGQQPGGQPLVGDVDQVDNRPPPPASGASDDQTTPVETGQQLLGRSIHPDMVFKVSWVQAYTKCPQYSKLWAKAQAGEFGNCTRLRDNKLVVNNRWLVPKDMQRAVARTFHVLNCPASSGYEKHWEFL